MCCNHFYTMVFTTLHTTQVHNAPWYHHPWINVRQDYSDSMHSDCRIASTQML